MDYLELYANNEMGIKLLVQRVRIFSENIFIEFGVDKCDILVAKRAK